jgi:hypothetical protein
VPLPRTNNPGDDAKKCQQRVGLFSSMLYHLASHRGEVDEDILSTFHHTFFVLFLLVGVVGGFLGSGCGSPHIPLPS